MKNKIFYSLFLLVAVLMLAGCNKREEPTSSVQEPVITQGQVFVSSGFKIKSLVTPQDVATLDPMIFEVYVDCNGNGSGLAGYIDNVYDVIIANDDVYVNVTNGTFVQLTNLTGHMIPTNLHVTSVNNLTQKGFTLVNNKVTSYQLSDDSMIIDSSYQSSDTIFDKSVVAQSTPMTVTELINYIRDTCTFSSSSDGDSSSSAVTEKESFYNNSWLGVKIHENTYSLGDYCNPSTYFEGSTPEGVTVSYAWNKDNKIELLHPSYISSDGRTVFMTTDGYVQSITTTSPFEFLGIKYGISEAELKTLLGIGLRNADKELWKPIVEGLTAVRGQSNTYIATYKDVTITFQMSSKTKTCTGITVSQYLDFVEG